MPDPRPLGVIIIECFPYAKVKVVSCRGAGAVGQLFNVIQDWQDVSELKVTG